MSHKIIKKYCITAKKSLGQNFLVDEDTLEQIVDITEIGGKNIIEVGPGYGALTEKIIAQQPKSLTLLELDRDMVAVLYDRGFGERANILEQDVLEYIPEQTSYSVIANIPYYITSPILRHFMYEIPHTPEEMIILMQADVAEKITSEKSSVLGLYIKKKYHTTHGLDVPKEYFSPSPKVDSSVVYFQKHEKYREVDDDRFLDFITAGFVSPRKKLINNLVGKGYNREKILGFLSAHNLGENIRAQQLSIEQWISFLEVFNQK